MPRLEGADYEAVLGIVAEASGGSAEMPLPVRVLDRIRRLVGSDTCALFEGLPWDREHRRVWITGAAAPWTADERAIVDRFRFQIPTLPSPATIGRAVRISDRTSQTAYRRLDIYALAGRQHGIEYALEYWMPAPDGISRGLVFDRAVADFSDRDRDVVEVLGHHLAHVLGRFDPMLPARREAAGQSVDRLTARQAEILAWVALGRTNDEIASILSLSPHTVRTHLEHAFDVLGVHSRTAAVAAVSARSRPSPAQAAALTARPRPPTDARSTPDRFS